MSTYPMSITEYVDGTRLACQNQASGATTTSVARDATSSGRRLTSYGAVVEAVTVSGSTALALLAAIKAALNRMNAFSPWTSPR